MVEKMLSSDRYSFYKLFKEKDFKIEIPIIQRDYAQGRNTQINVRDAFLDALYKYLEENVPNRDLDFVYGSIENGKFIPLDGQQRLTTLFLLHWYLCQICEDESLKQPFYETMTIKGNSEKETKSKFTYETRRSSSEFCDSLMKFHLSKDKISAEVKISDIIEDESWFFRLWQLDPTVKSMLQMLDSIHQKFYGKGNFFAGLLSEDNPIITFLFMDLKKFKLSDDLYIKMNARGKPLSEFENFKAKFEQYIETIEPKIESLHRDFKLNDKSVSLKDYFSHNIDTKWADLFWTYRKIANRSNSAEDNDFDDEFVNFIRFVFNCNYAGSINIAIKDKDETLEKLNTGSEVISFDDYCKRNVLSAKAILYLVDAFDVLSEQGVDITTHLAEYDAPYFDEKGQFSKILAGTASNNDKIQMHAYLRYLIENKDRAGLFDWMRVICNLSHPDNTIIDSSSEFSRSIRSVDSLLAKAPDILKHFAETTIVEGFSSWQVEEEKVKAKLMLASSEWRSSILKSEKENYPYFNGQIEILLESAGVYSYYREHAGSTWTSENVEQFRPSFDDYSNKFARIFDRSYSQNSCKMGDATFAFERAVLSKGNYLSYTNKEKKNLLNTSNTKQNIKRDHSWKRYLRCDGYNEDEIKRHNLVKEVLDDADLDLNDLINSLNKVALKIDDSAMWRYCFVHSNDVWNYGCYGWVLFDPNILYLFNGSKRSHWHREAYTYYLWEKYLESLSLNHSIKKGYCDSKNADILPRISITWKFDTEEVILDIFGARNRQRAEDVCDAIEIECYKSDDSAVSESVKKKLEEAQFNFQGNRGKRTFYCDKMNETCDAIVECLKKIDEQE